MALDPKNLASAEEKRGEGSDKSAGARQQEAPSPRAFRPPSYAAFVADAHFSCDFCIAVAVPLVMLGSIARSVDPRVGPRLGAEAAADTPRLCQAHGSSEALDSFPYGASAPVQVLHVTQHLVWYCLVRPARHGDWAGVLLNGLNLAFTATLLVIAVCPRQGPVWAWWRRHRFKVALATVLLARCVLILSTFLLLPPSAWPTHAWAGYVISASTSPLVNALALSVYDQLVKLTLRGSVVQAIAQTVAVFVLAYRVAPTVITRQLQLEQQQLCDAALGEDSVGGGGDDAAVPLQCGLRPEHAALLSCRPLAQQVLLGLAMVAWPVGLSWAVERRLRRQHAAMCGEWERRRQREQLQLESSTDAKKPQQRQHEPDPEQGPHSCRGELPVAHRIAGGGSASTAPADPPASATFAAPPARPAPAAVRPSSGTSSWTGGSTRYRSSMTAAVVSLKVQEHPGSHEEFGSRLASALHDAVRQELQVAAEAAAGGRRGGQESHAAQGGVQRVQRGAVVAQPVLWTSIIRGCVQVVLWGWVPEGLGGMDEAAVAESLLRRLARSLPQAGTAGGGGGVRGVSLQVGQAVAQLDDRGSGTAQHARAEGQELSGRQQQQQQQQMDLRNVLPFHGLQSGAGSGTARLLQVDPPAASVGALVASGSLTVRLLLHSPRPQPVRVLVLAEGGGQGEGEPNPARLLRELAVELVGGLQEVELALGAGELMGAVGADEVGVLQLVLVGPEHGTGELGEADTRGEALQPLVHWVAPPLLLLPDAAAQELCDLWERMKREEEQGQAGAGGSAPPAGHPAGALEALAGAEQQSCLWRSHLGPLLGDLAYVLGAGGQPGGVREVKGSVDGILRGLVPFLLQNGMSATAAMVEERSVERTRQGHTGGSPAAGAVPPPAATPELAGSSHAHASTSAISDICQSTVASVAPAAAATRTAASGATPAATAYGLLLLPRPFSPPSLELSYQSWRLTGLATFLPYLLGFCVCVYLTMVVRMVRIAWASGGAGDKAMPLARVWDMVFTSVLTTVANVVGQALLHVLVRVRSRQASQQLRRDQQQRQRRRKGGGATERSGLLRPSDIRAYRFAACFAGPAMLLLCAVLAVKGVTPLDPRMYNSPTVFYSCSLIRALVLPGLQQMSAWEAVAAAPLLGPAEALLVIAMQRGSGPLHAVATAVAWRLGAVAVSVVWERRTRQRFLEQQR